MKSIPILILSLAALTSQTAHGALYDRGGGLIYDDVLDVTWLQNIMYAAGSAYDDDYEKAPTSNPSNDGLLSYYSAVEWVESLEYYDAIRGVVWRDWRLPRALPLNGSNFNLRRSYDGTADVGYNITSPLSELSYMYYVNLGNKGQYDSSGNLQEGYGLVDDPLDPDDESLFINLKPGLYWYSTIRPDNDTNAFDFRMRTGNVTAAHLGYVRYPWAVRDGDVASFDSLTIVSVTATPSEMLDSDTSQLSVVAIDPDGGPQQISYHWSVVLGAGMFDDPHSATPLFIPADVTEAQNVVLRVYVSNGEDTVSATLSLQVNDASTPPPNAPPQILSLTATPTAILDTETSQLVVVASDPDAGPQTLSYQWSIVSGAGVLDDATSATPTYIPADVVGVQSVTLKVEIWDGEAFAAGDLNIQIQDANAPPPGPQLLSADFSGSTLAGWSVRDEGTISAPSKWRLVSGELGQLSNIYGGSTSPSDLNKFGTYLAYDEGVDWTDYRIRFLMRSADDDTLGVMFRIQDNDNYYRFSWDKQRKFRRIEKKEGGVFSLLAADNVEYQQGQQYLVEIAIEGEQLQLWVDGTRVFQVTDSAHGRGSLAFYTWMNNGAYFDELVVEDLSGGTFNASPRITSLTATPPVILDTETSQLSVEAFDPDAGPQPLSYQWNVLTGGGVLDDAASASPVYLPADVVGVQSVTLQVNVYDGETSVSGDLTLQVQNANAPPPGPVLLTENFSGSTLADWNVRDEGTISAPSKWRVSSGELSQLSNIRDGGAGSSLPHLGTYLLYENGSGWTDYRVKFKLRSLDDDTLGLMFRFQDEDNYYRFSWDKQLNQRRLVKKAGGEFILLAADNVPYVQGQDHQVEIVAQGSQMEVWIDGTRTFQTNDDTHPSGSIAFYTWMNNGAYFGDLLVNSME